MFILAGNLSVADCGGVEILRIIKFVWTLLDIVFIFIPIFLILFISFDFAKNVIAGKEDDMRKNVKIAIKRIIFAIVLFLVPIIVKAAINLVGNAGADVVSDFNDCIELAENEDLSVVEPNDEEEMDSDDGDEVETDSVEEDEKDKEEIDEEKIEEEKSDEAEQIFDVDLPNSVSEEIANYLLVVTSSVSSNYEKEKAYNDLSELAKKIIDKEIVVVKKEIHHYVEAREDIIVPEGKILINIGYRNALEGEVLKYNPDKNKYYSSSGGMGFSLENMANGKLVDK